MSVPVFYTFLWMCVFGGVGLRMERDAAAANITCDSPLGERRTSGPRTHTHHTHTHTHTHTYSYTDAHTHAYIHTHSLSRTHTHTLTHTHGSRGRGWCGERDPRGGGQGPDLLFDLVFEKADPKAPRSDPLLVLLPRMACVACYTFSSFLFKGHQKSSDCRRDQCHGADGPTLPFVVPHVGSNVV